MDDVRITGGRLVDPGNGIDEVGDIAVSAGRIRKVGQVEQAPARRVVDASGLLVTPGLVDMHTHIHAGSTFWGLSPDPIAWYTGVTTWVDAGSVGAYGLGTFLRARRDFAVRSHAFLHVAAQGLTARTGESRDLDDLNVDAAITAACAAPEVVRGVKVRMDATTVGENELEPLRRALAVAAAVGVPVMLHIGRGPFTLDQLVDLLRPGDIVTHCAGPGAAQIAEPGAVRDSLQAAYERGVVFDVGHGAGGFSFEVLEAYLEQGMAPQVISTDLHVLSVNGPAFDLPTVMGKLLAAGMSLTDVVRATTSTPAAALGLPSGGMAPGAAADLALFRTVDGTSTFGDVLGAVRTGSTVLRNVATFLAGEPLLAQLPAPPPAWVELSDAQRAALQRREDVVRSAFSEPLVSPQDVHSQIPPARTTQG